MSRSTVSRTWAGHLRFYGLTAALYAVVSIAAQVLFTFPR